MCGIAGFIDSGLAGDQMSLAARARAMGDALRHRGPDGDGYFIEANVGLGFAHRRLSIIDLSAAGQQPMTSANGRWVICYNGEVYNAEELRKEACLRDIRWRGHSDTEVILELAAAMGVEEMLECANGMFAIALWDRRDRVLHLARDRMGIKPLFVALGIFGLAFASELKAFKSIPAFAPSIDLRSVASFLRLGYVPAPYTIFECVQKVRPGEHCIVQVGENQSRFDVQNRLYWRLDQVAQRGAAAPLLVDDDQAVEALEALFRHCVGRQMISDVPLGAFLSGGIDSSLVAAMMVAARKGPVRTFSIGFEERAFDESKHAAAVAAHLKTEHMQLRVTAADALAVVPMLPHMYDEPFADSSQIATYLVSKLSRQFVTVALSGDGGDELFAGYNRHRLAMGLLPRLQSFPMGLRRAVASVLNAVPAGLADSAGHLLPARMGVAQAGDKLKKLARILPLNDQALYNRLILQNDAAAHLLPGVREHDVPGWDAPEIAALGDPLLKMQYLDMANYLPDDILQKVDRASMAVALEARPPLLDHRLVEFAWSLPKSMRIRNGETKWILRQVLDRHLPRALVERPKMGFAIPLDAWLRGPLRSWAEELIQAQQGMRQWCDLPAVEKLWARHLSGRENLAQALWPVLMLSAWAVQYTG